MRESRLTLLIWVFAVPSVAFLIAYLGALALAGPDSEASKQVAAAGSAIWKVISPAVQLFLIVIVVGEAAVWLGFRPPVQGGFLDRITTRENSIQSLIALIVIGSFALTAFLNFEGATLLKDVALVVVGFYFGTRVKDDENVNAAAETAIPPPPPPSGEADKDRTA